MLCTRKNLFNTSLSLLLLLISLVMPGCVNYSGIRNKQTLATPATFQTKKSLPEKNGQWPDLCWARQFGDPQLPLLIAEALRDNPQIQAAGARVDKARALASGQNSSLLPHVDFLGVPALERFSANSYFPPPFGGRWFSQGQVQFNFSYDLDFWGKNLSLLSQALSQEKASEAALQASRLMIATSVATTYNELAYEFALRDVLLRTVQQRKSLTAVTRRRVDNGLDTDTQLFQAQTQEATARTLLVNVDGQLLITRQQLGILLGAGPDRGLSITRPQLKASVAPKLPSNLPLGLLGRRPDIVAARWQAEAALYGVKHVKAKFYPDVNLLANYGYLSLGLDKLFSNASKAVLVQAAISLPVFDAGALRAELREQYASLDESIANYNDTLNQAFGDVAKQLASINYIEKQLHEQQLALISAEKAYTLSRKQYSVGLTSQLVVLDTETRYLQEQQQRLQLARTRRDLQIALIKALGGGFNECYLSTPRTTATPHCHLNKVLHG
ncbi:efflux transporter outer membrane subunit [Legionella sp. 16cNR16C]|uniref:efflux transporter outer membrane subunit n=1 Tax=Legionella sp. 16cNR16C TaxID=2905656 RepID=UPI0021066ADD|nr:efflux transporter outer membrane subunit [Legionella sp. 16cNR16C]